MSIQQGQVLANGIEFAYLEDGPADGPLALCLHGFPDCAWTYRHLLPTLAEAGFHAVAPWQRGYAPTAVPGDGRYQTGALVADANALHGALGGDKRAVIVGHDWGAMATYGAAAHAPERWSKVVAMAVPPAGALASTFLTFDQLRRSWYMFFFQSPLAEIAVSMDDLGFLDRLWADWSPGFEPGPHLDDVKAALRDPANLAAAIGYYRALFEPTAHDPGLADEQRSTQQANPQPTLYLHGAACGCVGVESARVAESFLAPGSEVAILDGVGHFLHLEQPEEINTRIMKFLAG